MAVHRPSLTPLSREPPGRTSQTTGDPGCGPAGVGVGGSPPRGQSTRREKACEHVCVHTQARAGHSHWHSLALSVVAGFHGCWLKPGQQRSQEPPHVLC